MIALVVVAIATALLIAVDVILVLTEGKQATISVQLYQFSQKYPVVPFAIGVLMGHLFWSQ